MNERLLLGEADAPVTESTHDDIEITLRAAREQLPVLRAVATTLAMRADFNLDEISDFELAVDEACSTLIMRVEGSAMLYCRFTLSDDELRLTASTTTLDPQPPSTTTFSWQILHTLTDTVSARVEPADDANYFVHMELTKRRQVTHT